MIASTLSHVIDTSTRMKCCVDFSSGNYAFDSSPPCSVHGGINNHTFRRKLIASKFYAYSLFSAAAFVV